MFFRNITADYRRITDLLGDRPWIVRIFFPFTTGGFQTLIIFRLIQANRHWRIPILYWIFAITLKIINTLFQAFWGICISTSADIGPGFYIAHHGMIFIGVERMGSNCTIGHNVTTGRTEKEEGYPIIGDNVYIAPGAMVIGNIEIGDNVKISPYAVVRRNVPANSVVVAPPPRVIKLTSKDEWERKKDRVESESSVNDSTAAKPKQPKSPEERRPEGDRAGTSHGTKHHRRGKPSYGDKKPSGEKERNGKGQRKWKDRRDKQPSQSSGQRSNNTPKVEHKSNTADDKRTGKHYNKKRPHRDTKSGQSQHSNPQHKNNAKKNTGADRNKNKVAEERNPTREDLSHKKATDSGGYHWSTDQRTKWVEDMDGESLDD